MKLNEIRLGHIFVLEFHNDGDCAEGLHRERETETESESESESEKARGGVDDIEACIVTRQCYGN